MKRVMIIYGTRPEVIKLAPVIRAIAASSRLCPVVTLTGQHQTIVEQVNITFGIRPDHDLDVIRPGQTLHGLTARILERLSRVLQQERPNAVVVQGDTTSAFAGALAAFYEHVPVVHVEAGLRTGRPLLAVPRRGQQAADEPDRNLHLAPTPVSEGNLLSDGIPSRRVMVTGNTVIDALLWTVQQCVPYGDPALEAVESADAPVLLVTTHRRESWGSGCDVASAVAWLARKHPDLIVVLPLHPNPLVREALLPSLHGLDNVMLVEPMDYGAFARLLQRSTIVLTDSGGIQEEAPSLGKPVLVMRDTTERPEAVTAGRPGWSAPIRSACIPRSINCSPLRGPIRRWPTPSTPTATVTPRSGLSKQWNTCSILAVGRSPSATAPPPVDDPPARPDEITGAETISTSSGRRWTTPSQGAASEDCSGVHQPSVTTSRRPGALAAPPCRRASSSSG